MKKNIILLSSIILFSISTTIFGQQNVQTTIDKAIVFSSGGQIERTKKVNLKQGENVISFVNLETAINAKTIQVFASDKITIVSTDFKRQSREKESLPKNIVEIMDSLEILARELKRERGKRSNYVSEKNMILSNKVVGGGSEGFDIEDLMDLSDFYRSKINEIDEIVYQSGD